MYRNITFCEIPNLARSFPFLTNYIKYALTFLLQKYAG